MKVVRRELMLAVSPLRTERNERESDGYDAVFDGADLLGSIDFDDIFAGIDVMPHLEMDCETLAEFSGSDSGSAAPDSIKAEESEPVSESKPAAKNPDSEGAERSRKKPAGKKKAKVDWTPELHRRFVTAVDQLGIDKAVPSRILEIMGIDCLTRHNIASHLQKYRSHRKHILAREAEAASWSRRRQMYGTAAAQTDLNPWIAPTTGFPPVAPAPHFRPLHVWGHPSVDQSLMYTWPKHVAPPLSWPPPPSALAVPSFWHPQHPYVPPPATLTFPPQFPPTIFSPPPIGDVPAAHKLPKTPSDFHPSKESIDAAIGDVLAKPWLPLPLGLKPPSIDGVMVELQRQGVSRIPPPPP